MSHATNHCRGFTLLECLVATGMLGVIFVLVGQWFAWDGVQRREAWQRQVATHEATNVLERLSLAPYETLTADNLAAIKLSPETQAWLIRGALQVSVSETTTPAPGKQLQVEVRWNGGHENPSAPVRLTTWRFAPGAVP